MDSLKASAVALINRNRRIFLQYRSKDAPKYPNYWDFFGGGIEQKDKTIKEAARRELKEELNIELKNLKHFKTYEFRKKDGIFKIFLFTAFLSISVDQLKKQQNEGQDLGLFTFKETKDLKMTNGDKIALMDLYNAKKIC